MVTLGTNRDDAAETEPSLGGRAAVDRRRERPGDNGLRTAFAIVMGGNAALGLMLLRHARRQERLLDTVERRVLPALAGPTLPNARRTEDRALSDVLESSADGLIAVGSDMSVRAWNPAIAHIVGVPRSQAVGQPIGKVFHPIGEDGRPRFGQADPGPTGRPEVALVRIEDAAGDERWLTCSWSPLDEGGYVVVARDDTERKRLQDEKDEWVAQVSHELRTPLTPIKGFLHTLQRRDEQFTSEDRQRIYEVMMREEQRLEDLVGSLLHTTSIDQHGMEVTTESLHWPTILQEQAQLYRRSDPTRTIEVDVSADVAQVEADRNLATGVVANLLSNALKYAPEGSAITVDARLDADRVVTTVSDSGPGVPPTDRDRIFDKFTRLGDHLTRPQQGVGLGLFIARRSVDGMGGEIWCEERPGGGARFGFTLPAVLSAPASTGAPGDDDERVEGRPRSR